MQSETAYSRLFLQHKLIRSRPYLCRPNESSAPQAILKSMLLPDEHLLQIGMVSLGIYWKSVAVLILSALFMLLMFVLGLPFKLMILLAVVLCLKVLIMLTMAFLTRHYLLLAATDKRVIIRVGIINLEVVQMRYAQIESSEVSSTIPGRFFGYSSVFISGTGGHTLAVPFIVNAMEFRKTVSEILVRRDDLEEHAR